MYSRREEGEGFLRKDGVAIRLRQSTRSFHHCGKHRRHMIFCLRHTFYGRQSSLLLANLGSRLIICHQFLRVVELIINKYPGDAGIVLLHDDLPFTIGNTSDCQASYQATAAACKLGRSPMQPLTRLRSRFQPISVPPGRRSFKDSLHDCSLDYTKADLYYPW